MAIRIVRKLADALARPDAVRRLELLAVRRGTKLPQFAMFSHLEELTIHARGSGLATFPRITGCVKLRALTFTSSEIKSVPADLGELARLETLILVGHRKLKKLPDEVTQLSKLRRLQIDSNGLIALPANIGDLSALETLIAYGNALTDVPASLAKLKRLRWLEVQMNRMTKPPAVLSKLAVRHLQTDFDGLDRYSGAL